MVECRRIELSAKGILNDVGAQWVGRLDAGEPCSEHVPATRLPSRSGVNAAHRGPFHSTGWLQSVR